MQQLSKWPLNKKPAASLAKPQLVCTRPPLLSEQFSKLPNIYKSNHHIWDLL